MPEIKPDLFSSLRRVFFTFSFGATVAMPEMEFVRILLAIRREKLILGLTLGFDM